ncbi:hypothetical protein VL20_3412 [Microcystis panniformis FACHB-1757]|uniref:Mobile element protein n=1 Tax=Microcystis panniformis FACHB-1757 TaxID=1638788 RepID=A0A0K1S2P3_9CHRO|nr:hypothetical protein VL20_3412 [Microcystis panniformis FACHB-1757]
MKRDEVLTILATHREQLEKLGVKSLSLRELQRMIDPIITGKSSE